MKIERISVIVPCYNESETIQEFFRRVHALAQSMNSQIFEFIFVNDGSTDETISILNELSERDRRVKVLHLARNQGHQIALTAGMDHASGDVIVTIDSDLQHPPEIIPEMIQKIELGYDIVHAQRRKRTGDKWFKLVSAKLFYFLMRSFSGVRLIENCGDFRAITASVLEVISCFRTPYRFLRGIFVDLGFKQCIIQYDSNVRYAGKTKYSLVKMMNLAIDAALGFSATPIRLISWLSILLWSLSLVHLIKSLIEYFIFKITVPGWTSIIVLMFFFTGLILFSIAIIGSYVGRIFMQGHHSPLYWISDARNIDLEQIANRVKELQEVKLSRNILKIKDKDNYE